MRRMLLLIGMALVACLSFAQGGMPFIRNYTSAEYHAHNRNFDVVTDDKGVVYFANFEGLLYYDNVEWRILHTPGITRITVVYRDLHHVIWVAGYNYFGRLATKQNGELFLQQVSNPGAFKGEVEEIWENDGELLFLVNDGNIYKVENDKVVLKKNVNTNAKGVSLSDVVQIDAIDKGGEVVVLDDVTQTEPLENGLKVVVKKGRGLSVTDENGRELYTITEANGLCNDNVIWVAYNGHGLLWGATDDGVFSIAIPSVFTHYTSHDGLLGDVASLETYEGHMYVGTNRALLRQEGRSLVAVPGVDYACWDLKRTPQGLLVATPNGIYLLSGSTLRQLTTTTSLSLLADGIQYYSGELDGVYLMQLTGKDRLKICDLEKVTKMLKDSHGTIWLQSMYGEVWKKETTDKDFKPYSDTQAGVASTIVPLNGEVVVVNVDEAKPFSYPLYSYMDDKGITWLTDKEGKSLYRWKDGKRVEDMKRLLFPFADLTVRSIFKQQHEVWFGSDHGLSVIDESQKDIALNVKPRLLFRTVRLNGDSILWGGFGEMPKRIPRLDSDDRNLRFTYSIDFYPLVGKTLYRYRLNGGSWSVWDDDKEAEFLNLPHGSYTIEIQARLANGEESEIVAMDFRIAYPFYLRWYMLILYFLLLCLIGYLIVRWRLSHLEQEKIRLEIIVQERTSEVVRQKDEIEEKSKSLENALSELHEAQGELIRQEKMATAGKLTQGLIDRILNPLNYINNFTKLSEGLVKDIQANIEDEKDNMDGENYEDTMDVLSMLVGNMQKVSEHGQNTTRVLKAMEEMLKDRTGGIVPMNLSSVLKKNEEMMHSYFDEKINEHGIKVVFDYPEEIPVNANPEQLSMTLMSILGNGIYAVVKKAMRADYQPEVSLKVRLVDEKVYILIRDNGIGIEDTIIGKIFDPFFTTKPTGEAAGVGLYISREIVQNVGGDITVDSQKDVYTEFTIILPKLNA